MRWGWNKEGTRAKQKGEGYFLQYDDYVYPPADNPEVAALIQNIEDVFSKTPMPSEKALITSQQSDEPAEYALTFRGLEWHKIHPQLLETCSDALSFFTPQALRYYVPAFLRAHLYGYHDADPIFCLTYKFYKAEWLESSESNPAKMEEHQRERMSLFTNEERKVIIAYFRYIVKLDSFNKNAINQALENYWLPSCG